MNLINFFPENKTPFPQQVEALNQIEQAIQDGYKFIVLQAPTGSGKSFIAKTIGNSARKASQRYIDCVNSNAHILDQDHALTVEHEEKSHGCYVLTTTKSLQTQYVNEFKDMFALKGKANYSCEIDETVSVDMAPCVDGPKIRVDCLRNKICPYYNVYADACVSQFSTLNYSKYFCLGFGAKRQYLVCDECSEIESEVVNYYSCLIEYKKLKANGIEIEQKLTSENPNEARAWLNDVLSAVSKELSSIKNENSNAVGLNKGSRHKIKWLTDFESRVGGVIDNWSACQYIIEIDKEWVSYTPFKVDKLVHNVLFDHADVIIMMSATIPNHKNFAKTLGIEKYKYIEVESQFDPLKSPIYISKKHPLNFKNMQKNLPIVLDMVEKIVKHHENEKGVIHTHTHNITRELQKRLTGPRFLYRDEVSNNETIVEEHLMRQDPTVLISPSLTMGLDLKGDAGKWQIIVKLPYASLGNKRIKKMADEDQQWYVSQMFKDLIQACGRCTRGVNDESVTYILDGSIFDVLLRNGGSLPKHFLARFAK